MGATMARAKTLTQMELKRVLDLVKTRAHPQRNRALVLLSHLAGLRAKEMALLRVGDVLDSAGKMRDEVTLTADQTKGRYARVVYFNTKLRRELTQYIATHPSPSASAPLFPTQKSATRGFTPNTLAQFFHQLYKQAGIEGASSHSGRRTYLTTLADKGTSIHILKALAGHRNISTTAVYLDSSPAKIKAAAELI